MSKSAYSVDGGTGRDTVSFHAAKSGVGLDLGKGAGTSGAASGFTFKSIEKVTGSNFADTITGDSAKNTLSGGGGNDKVSGGAGNDRLSGGLGNDKLTGGLGSDTFKFDSALNSKTNVDTISDFSVTADRIALAHSIFSGLKAGSLSADQFHVGSHAHDANDRVIYDSKTGALSYDADGNGHGAAVQFATLKPGLAVDHHDFLIV
jgi:serralysin